MKRKVKKEPERLDMEIVNDVIGELSFRDKIKVIFSKKSSKNNTFFLPFDTETNNASESIPTVNMPDTLGSDKLIPKSVTRKIIDIFIVLSSLAYFTWLAYAHYRQEGIGYYMKTESEVFCYALCAFCYLGAFKMMSRNIKPVWVKWIFALVPATLFTIQVILYNPFLHFIDWNVDWYYVKYGEIIPYKQFLENDLTYKVGLGEYRYLFCFLILYVLCAVVILLQSDRGKSISKKMICSISSLFDFGTTNIKKGI